MSLRGPDEAALFVVRPLGLSGAALREARRRSSLEGGTWLSVVWQLAIGGARLVHNADFAKGGKSSVGKGPT